MIAEPYICTKGPRAGEIQWYQHIDPRYVDSAGEYHHEGVPWRVYADFEREKLRELDGFSHIVLGGTDPYRYWRKGIEYRSEDLIGYYRRNYLNDSESSRLLKRAEFLKAVCEKENVAWIESIAWCHCKNPRKDGFHQIQGKCENEGTELKPRLWIGETKDTLVEVPVESIKIEYGPVKERDIVKELCACQSGDERNGCDRFHKPPTVINNVTERPERDYYTKTESEEALLVVGREIRAAESKLNAVVEHLHGMFCNMDLSLWPKDQAMRFRQATETLRRWFQ